MRKSAFAKIALILIGTTFLGYAAYLRSETYEDENTFIVIGIIIIILAVISFFFGESEEKITQEE
ncbi:MAG TPA: hypothetical protein QGF52_04915 [Nitrososphaerales archaeon]|nr:hypothetical protein [Nitrososphaerales archaeon]